MRLYYQFRNIPHSVMATSIVYRRAEESDCEQLWGLIKELYEYEKLPRYPSYSVEELRNHGFNNPKEPMFRCLVAETQGALVGYCMYYYTYSSREGPSVYLEDLYVSLTQRGRKIGQNMWKKVVKSALSNGCLGCSLDVLDWNEASIRFYQAMGATGHHERKGWLTFKMDRPAMEKFISE